METTKIEISTAEGYTVIDRANGYFKDFTIEVEGKRNRERIFKEIFRESVWKHLSDKYAGYGDLGGFYLNLDMDCWQRLLNYCFKYHDIDTELPAIPDWEKIADELNITDPDHRTEKMIRKLCVSFRKKTYWEIWPHSMVWLYKWMLYANNHGIDGFGFDEETKKVFDVYKGNRFGNWTNWAEFWNWCPRSTKNRIIEKLVEE